MSNLEAFANAAQYHFDNPPSAWTVRKWDDRNWHVVNSAGDTIERYTTKRAATAALTDPYGPVRLYQDRERWYLGQSKDARDRKLTDAEQAAIESIIGKVAS